jgi:hypothetical protein
MARVTRTVADEDQRHRDNRAYWRRVWAEQRAAEQRAEARAEAEQREREDDE